MNLTLIIDPRSIGKKLILGYHEFRQLIREHLHEFFRFEIGIILGFLVWIVLNSLFGLSGLIIGLPLAILIILSLLIIKILGLEELGLEFLERILDWIERNAETENTFEVLPSITDLIAVIIESITEFTKALTRLGRAIFANLEIMFPILLDINIDLDWLHISFPYLVRTFFNIVQFAIMYYVFRSIKQKLKNRIKEKLKEEIQIKKYVWFGDI